MKVQRLELHVILYFGGQNWNRDMLVPYAKHVLSPLEGALRKVHRATLYNFRQDQFGDTPFPRSDNWPDDNSYGLPLPFDWPPAQIASDHVSRQLQFRFVAYQNVDREVNSAEWQDYVRNWSASVCSSEDPDPPNPLEDVYDRLVGLVAKLNHLRPKSVATIAERGIYSPLHLARLARNARDFDAFSEQRQQILETYVAEAASAIDSLWSLRHDHAQMKNDTFLLLGYPVTSDDADPPFPPPTPGAYNGENAETSTMAQASQSPSDELDPELARPPNEMEVDTATGPNGFVL
ncbi:hypothetical protein BDY21DRAFT_332547 [Lineolata rhizophorae]|uniref:Uncharacterized protein n=1 Tax=Lineolata rhizophorae TaxID=578093 RepID=A0A6A6PCB6_9PEZI|nr:hypothetical protein BDY21DRAFT_332547 [Lineolata rhizophorae]